ncbi:MAG: ATP-dependent DNA helicase RecG [Patescibacteria group bacterium]|nr:ATP-dependent DNA helicase RecG [Patescibacteria group bacterium]
MDLFFPIQQVDGVGPIFQKKLGKLGIKTIRDILFHFPHRYEDFSNIIPISKIKINEIVCIFGKILEIKTIKTYKKKMFLTQAIIEDKTGAMRVVWFRQPYLTKSLKKDDYICVTGKVASDSGGIYISNPAYEKTDKNFSNLTHTGRVVPIYPETERLSSRWLRYIIKSLLSKFSTQIPEILPREIILKNKLMPIRQAIWQIHFPDSLNFAKKAQERFAFEELFLIQMSILRARALLNKQKAPAIPMDIALIKKFIKSLDFKLTDAQRKCAYQILKDLEKPFPMNRLLEGDVGSGKTIVALIAGLQTIKAKKQVAFMAPTEILAKQHFQETAKLLQGFNVNIGLLTGKEDKFISKKLNNQVIEISRKKLLEKTKKNEINILIGTHTLIQDKVKFENLGLVILDEQHRFGVDQRAKLNAKTSKLIPHLLSMTATPIPRTLALTVYGDLDLSIIDTLPKGRKKIITKLIPPANRDKAYKFIKKQIKKTRQVFVICPRIEARDQEQENSEEKNNPWANVKTIEQEYEELSKKVFPDLNIEILHGKMTPKEKEKIMSDFKNKKNDILISTSVIEVGIDVPNATVMFIEGADRFGLAQLHQFRGRVGRAKYQSYCLLFTDSTSQKTHQRLKALISSENGFELAEKDLQIRGPGNFMGTRQWGIPDLAMKSLKNMSLVEQTRTLAQEILEQDPELKNHSALSERLKKFQEKIHLE